MIKTFSVPYPYMIQTLDRYYGVKAHPQKKRVRFDPVIAVKRLNHIRMEEKEVIQPDAHSGTTRTPAVYPTILKHLVRD